MSIVANRIACPHCEAECFPNDKNCWQCHKKIKEDPKPPIEEMGSSDLEIAPGLIRFGDDPEPEIVPETPIFTQPEVLPYTPSADLVQVESEASRKRTRISMTGEIIEEDGPAVDSSKSETTVLAGQIGKTQILIDPGEEVMILSFCKHCGHQNPEGLKECEKCKTTLDIVAVHSYKEMEALPRSWGFDILGVIWIILGGYAVYAGQFLIKADANVKGIAIADYLWTGFVVCAPGILIFLRHYFCKLLFWILTLGSALVWSVIGFIWILGKLAVSDNNQVTLIWLAVFSGLCLASWYTVRSNDAFDAGF